MTIRNISLTLAMALLPVAAGAITAKEAFLNAPPAVLPLIDNSTRMDMVDYFEAGSPKESVNDAGGNTSIKAMTPDIISVSTSKSANLDIYVLRSGKKETLTVVQTIFAPAPISFVEFYTADWEPLDGNKIFKRPTLEEWTVRLPKDVMPDIENALPFMAAKATIEPSDGVMTLTPTIDQVMTNDDYIKYKAYFKPNLKYKWDGKRMKPLK